MSRCCHYPFILPDWSICWPQTEYNQEPWTFLIATYLSFYKFLNTTLLSHCYNNSVFFYYLQRLTPFCIHQSDLQIRHKAIAVQIYLSKSLNQQKVRLNGNWVLSFEKSSKWYLNRNQFAFFLLLFLYKYIFFTTVGASHTVYTQKKKILTWHQLFLLQGNNAFTCHPCLST